MTRAHSHCFQWSERLEVPTVVKAFVEAYRAYHREQQIVRCAFDLPWQEGPAPDADFVILDIEDLDVQVPAFAVTNDLIGQDSDVPSRHKIVPIGLEVILEGIARLIQNSRVRASYGPEVLELIEERLRTPQPLMRMRHPIPRYFPTPSVTSCSPQSSRREASHAEISKEAYLRHRTTR